MIAVRTEQENPQPIGNGALSTPMEAWEGRLSSHQESEQPVQKGRLIWDQTDSAHFKKPPVSNRSQFIFVNIATKSALRTEDREHERH